MSWTVPEIPSLTHELAPALQAAINDKTKPPGSLGRLEELALRLGLIQGTTKPAVRGAVLVVAGDHGLAAEGVSPFPQAVTGQMVLNFLGGGAAINVFARQMGLPLGVVDAGVATSLPDHPSLKRAVVRVGGTRNARHEPALTPEEVARGFCCGEKLVEEIAANGANVLLLGEMGIGNTSAAALVMSALLDLPVADCAGRGAGHDDAGLAAKIAVLEATRQRHAAAVASGDPQAVLAAFGGCELVVMAGAMLAAAARRMVILCDGFIVSAALLAASRIDGGVLDYAVFAHASAEQAHRRLVAAMDGRPLLDLEMRLGEGTGAALAWPLVQAAANFLNEMATFSSAGVSKRDA